MVTIVWDVDDVLNDLQRRWLKLAWRPLHPGSALTYADLTANPPDRVLGVTREEYLDSLDAFRHTPGYADQPPQPDVLTWFDEHGAVCRHVALSAVPMHAAHLSAAWVLRIFGRWIRSFTFIPSARPGDPAMSGARDKGAWLEEFGAADLFIDDSETHVQAARAAGVPAQLFPRPWNRDAARPVADLLAEITTLCGAAAAPYAATAEGDAGS